MLQNDFYHIRVLHSFMILFLPFIRMNRDVKWVKNRGWCGLI